MNGWVDVKLELLLPLLLGPFLIFIYLFDIQVTRRLVNFEDRVVKLI